MSSDFSNQAYVDDSPQDRMVLSQFGGAGESDFGYAAFSYGDVEDFDLGEQINQITAPGVVTTRERELMKSIKGYHDYLHSAEHAHPLSGMAGFEGWFSRAKQSVKEQAQKSAQTLVGAVKGEASKKLSAVATAITSDPKVQQAAAEQVKQQATRAVAEKILETAETAKQAAEKAKEVAAKNRTPILIGIGAALALYLYFRRK